MINNWDKYKDLADKNRDYMTITAIILDILGPIGLAAVLQKKKCPYKNNSYKKVCKRCGHRQ